MGISNIKDWCIQLNKIAPTVKEYEDKLYNFYRANGTTIEYDNSMMVSCYKDIKYSSVVAKAVFSKFWLKIIVACLPAAVIGFLFDDWFESHFFNPETVAIALIVYGIIFIVIENVKKFSSRETRSINTVTYKEAFGVGLFQILALIPGTSRSGSTIIGGLLFGMDRKTAADFTFILAIPVMAGASLLKLIKYLKAGLVFTTMEIEILVVASLIAFLVSMVVIKFFLDYIRKHNFKPFRWYRIALGILVLVYFFIIK
jgi:undecaprenyl-diphosphatase